MGTFGEFEPLRPVHRSSGSVVYLACKGDDPDERFALKVFAGQSTFGPLTLSTEDGDPSFDRGSYDFSESDESLKKTLAERLELIRLQRDLALGLGDAGHWAPVYETGLSSYGPFAILDWYPRSIDTLSRAGGGARMGPTSVYHILSGVVRGLIELRDRASRAHGNLKASNVFLLGSGRRVTDWRILLSDIGFSGLATEAGDVANLGRLLYHCVTQQEFKIADFEVQDSESWRRLGRKSAKWRELCARMVDPLPGRRPTLDEVAIALRRLRTRKLVPPPYDRYLMVVMLGAVATIVVGYTIWIRQNSKDWKQYQDAYRGWYRDARSVVSPDESGGDALYKSLDELFRKENKGRPAHCADLVMMRHWEEWKEIRAPRPDSIPAYSPLSASQLVDANRQAEELAEAIRSWPARLDLEQTAKALRELGWVQAAEYLDRKASDPLILLSGTGEPSPVQFAASIAIVAELNRALGQYKDDSADHLLHHTGILDHLQKIDDDKLRAADPVLNGLKARIGRALVPSGTFTDGKPEPDPPEAIFDFRVKSAAKKAAILAIDLKSLNQNLKAVADQLRPINDAVTAGKWVPSPSVPGQKPETIDQIIEDLRSRLVHSQLASRTPPWVDAPVVNDIAVKLATLKATSDALQSLTGSNKEWAARFLNAAALAQTRNRVGADLKQIQMAELTLGEIKKLPFPSGAVRIQSELDKLREAVAKIDADGRRKEVDELIRSGKTAEARGSENFKAWQENRFKPTRPGTDPLADERADAWARWLPELAKAAEKLDGPTATRFYDEAATALEGYSIPVPTSNELPKDWGPEAASFASVYIEQLKVMWPSLLAAKLHLVSDKVVKDGVVAADRLKSAASEQAGVYLADQASLIDAARSAGELRVRLLHCERFDERSKTTIGQAADSLAERQRQATGKAGEILRADTRIAQLLEDCSMIKQLEVLNSRIADRTFKSADRVELKRIATGARASVETRRNAWMVLQRMTREREGPDQKLAADVDPWPFNETELQEELLNRRNLLADLKQRAAQQLESGQEPENWRSVVESELKEAGPETLRRYIDRTVAQANAGDVRSLIRGLTIKELLQGFACDEKTFRGSLPLMVRARELIEEVMAQRPAKDEDANRAQMQKLKEDLAGLIATDPNCPQTIKKLSDALTQKLNAKAVAVRPGFELTGLARLDWKTERIGDDRVRYSWPTTGKATSIEFVRVSPGSSAYLATTETSLEMVNAIMKSAVAKRLATPDWKDFWTLVVNGEGAQGITATDISRKGPRAWKWGGKELVLSPSWLISNVDPHYPALPGQAGATSKERLPPGYLGGEPRLSHPFHRVSPGEAVYLATIAGGRLPTQAEWKAAYAVESKSATESAAKMPLWNRRDAIFASQVKHAAAHQTTGVNRLNYPDSEIFVPQDYSPLKPTGSAAVQDNVPADSVLWFCPVDSNGTINPATGEPKSGNAPGTVYKHLVGNVSEYITERAVSPVAQRQGNGVGTDELASAVEKWLHGDVKEGKNEKRIATIGGSALSPPEYVNPADGRLSVSPETALPVDVTTSPETWWKRAYCDVGIRLAIDVQNAGESLVKWFDDQLTPVPLDLANAHRELMQPK